MPKPIEVQYLTIHGHKRAFIKTGSGPALSVSYTHLTLPTTERV